MKQFFLIHISGWFFAIILMTILSCHGAKDWTKEIAIAKSHFDKGQYAEAIAVLSMVIAENPEDRDALELRAQCYYELMQRDLQAKDLKRLLILPSTPCEQRLLAVNGIVNAYDYLQQLDSAIKYQWELVSIQRSCPQKLFPNWSNFSVLSNLNQRIGKYETALDLSDSAHNHGLDNYAFADGRAWIFSKMDALDSALFWINYMIGMGDKNKFLGDDHAFRASLYQRRGEMELACGDWRMAMELGVEGAQVKWDSFCLASNPGH